MNRWQAQAGRAAVGFIVVLGGLAISAGASAQTPAGAPVISDDFQRSRLVDAEHPWVTNDARAQRTSGQDQATFQPQAQLADGKLRMVRTPGSDHAATARIPGQFGDVLCRLKFRLEPDDKFSFNFNDPGLKETVHAGHVCKVEIGPRYVLIQDQMKGSMNLEFRQLREAEPQSPQVAQRLAATTRRIPAKIDPGRWHDLEIRIEGARLQVSLDGQPAGEFESPGLGHPTKQNVALSVPRKLEVDELRVWSLAKQE